ncbi:hypothetical protein CP967_07245 [Streptomyces nitrosporeus]|uniref:HTH-like domain-containing protein n=1 Tax=Streptomyces nitrosporeus TaxID=28894 RepID=A0A5J6F769_9ACTN|nr:hypothetical protein CP967_07245 [Streptomyces nitrosporeus]
MSPAFQRRHGVERLCSILGVSRSGFCYWRRTAADRSARQAAEARLAARIRAVHLESDGTYGAPRITAELREENGEAVNHKRVARIMRASGIEGVRLRRRHRTTVPDPAATKAPDLIGRGFTADRPNTKYVGDITYLPVDGGKSCYLATVIDPERGARRTRRGRRSRPRRFNHARATRSSSTSAAAACAAWPEDWLLARARFRWDVAASRSPRSRAACPRPISARISPR